MREVGERRVWSVGEVNLAVARRLAGVPAVWVEAEIHSVHRAGDQVYFTLVDGDQISASMPVGAFQRSRPPDAGARVQALGRVEFWRRRARVSFRVERLEATGEGALLARVAALRAALEQDGLLAAGRKRRIPLLPRRVGVVTSAKGAAVTDLVTTMESRFAGVDVVLTDVPVQGAAAAGAVSRAITRLNTVPGVDVIVVTRGGGPLEDLMAFNSEMVCRTVAASRVPVVSAVGHERDVTLCDLVADLRVATPTAAGAAVVPDAGALSERVESLGRRLGSGLERAAGDADRRARAGAARLADALGAQLRVATERATRAGGRLAELLRTRAAADGHAVEARGRGLMCAIDLPTAAAADAVNGLLARGFLANATGPRTLRFLPPLVIEPADVDGLLAALGDVLTS